MNLRRHPTVDAVLDAFAAWALSDPKATFAEIDGWGAANLETGESVEISPSDSKEAIIQQGIWGFMDCGSDTVHVWASSECSMRQLVGMIAHEVGHAQRPHHRDVQTEELKAEHYRAVAEMAFDLAEQFLTEQSGK